MVRVSSPAKLRPWSELTAKMVMGVVPGLVTFWAALTKVYVPCAEPKEHKHFRPGTRPGGIGYPAGRIGDRGDREIVYVPNVYVPFSGP